MQSVRGIGIIAGMGPFAGLDLLQKILEQTNATSDQDHLKVFSISHPSAIQDRTIYLLRNEGVNPAYAIVKQMLTLENIGAEIVALNCNTAHAPRIFDVIIQELNNAGSQLHVINMIKEAAAYLSQSSNAPEKIALLCTRGSRQSGVYQEILLKYGIEVVLPDDYSQYVVDEVVYNSEYGLKSTGGLTSIATAHLEKITARLKGRGAKAIILGCTELPLAISATTQGKEWLNGLIAIDPTLILARAIVREAAPEKLRPLLKAIEIM